MGNTKDTKKSGSSDSMQNKPDHEFEGSGQKKGNAGQQAGGSKQRIDDDDMTAGGREGKFSDTGTSNKGQWSPGSSHESDR